MTRGYPSVRTRAEGQGHERDEGSWEMRKMSSSLRRGSQRKHHEKFISPFAYHSTFVVFFPHESQTEKLRCIIPGSRGG